MSDNENSLENSVKEDDNLKSDESPQKIESIAEEMVNDKKKKEKIPGVIYLSRIPNKMNVKIIREYMSTVGEIGRIYLEPRPENKKRKNQPPSFIEGWVEFKKKRDAKKAALMLNNKQVGGRRRNPWYHDLWNIKYLKEFRWTHLNERMAYEQEMRKQRLRQEVSLAKKEANFFIQNYEKSENRKRIEKRLQLKNQQDFKNTENIDTNRIDEKKDSNKSSDNNSSEKFSERKQHPLFERKIKVAGNDSFLKQIFS